MEIDWSSGRSLSDVLELLEEAQSILNEECVDLTDSGLIGARKTREYDGNGHVIESKTLWGCLETVSDVVKQLVSGKLQVNIDGSVKE